MMFNLDDEEKYNISNFYIGELLLVEKFGSNDGKVSLDRLKKSGAKDISFVNNTDLKKRERYYKVLTIFMKVNDSYLCLHDGNVYKDNVSGLWSLSSLLPKYSYHIKDKISIRKSLGLYSDLFHKGESLECLYNDDNQWFSSPLSGNSNLAWVVDGTGYVGYGNVDFAWGVRPVVVLKSDVKMVGGEGTNGSPYKLALSE